MGAEKFTEIEHDFSQERGVLTKDEMPQKKNARLLVLQTKPLTRVSHATAQTMWRPNNINDDTKGAHRAAA